MSKLTVVMYHYVRDLSNSRYPNIKGLDVAVFKKQLDFLEQNYTIIRMEQLFDYYSQNTSLPENSLLLTFDDGYKEHFDTVFPILDSHKIQGSFFIPCKTFCENSLLDVNKIHFVLANANVNDVIQEIWKQLDYYRGKGFLIDENNELYSRYGKGNRFDSNEIVFVKRLLQTGLSEELRSYISSYLFHKFVGIDEAKFAKELYCNYDQIKCMKKHGMFIGLHGYDHYWLGDLKTSEMKRDIDKALSCMDEFIDGDCWAMNYPYGSWNKDVIEYITGKGCKIGFTTEVRFADIYNDAPLLLPRLDTNDFPPKSFNYQKVK